VRCICIYAGQLAVLENKVVVTLRCEEQPVQEESDALRNRLKRYCFAAEILEALLEPRACCRYGRRSLWSSNPQDCEEKKRRVTQGRWRSGAQGLRYAILLSGSSRTADDTSMNASGPREMYYKEQSRTVWFLLCLLLSHRNPPLPSTTFCFNHPYHHQQIIGATAAGRQRERRLSIAG